MLDLIEGFVAVVLIPLAVMAAGVLIILALMG